MRNDYKMTNAFNQKMNDITQNGLDEVFGVTMRKGSKRKGHSICYEISMLAPVSQLFGENMAGCILFRR